MRATRCWSALLCCVVMGCRYQGPPVHLQGTAADLAALAGTWTGDYYSAESQRSGSIVFEIRAGSDTAFGDVAMVSPGGERLVAADGASGMHRHHASVTTALRIAFVAVSGGMVEGRLEPYIAPDCNCVVTTVFRGARAAEQMEGTYVTRSREGRVQEGRWMVRRSSGS